ncbi:MAG: phosphoglucosamine mutase, partial [Candidatus Omnitrophica bacterium]|nr:phosphoglucosamine mutase [Candidatus Omnitrophota bacterium]
MALFGTDGIRGRVGTGVFTEPNMRKLGDAIGIWLSGERLRSKAVFIGRDTRESGELFEKMLACGLKGHGFEPVSLGIVTTPGVSYLASHLKPALGIMISASHNLWHDNGIKLFGNKGLKV